MPQLTWLGDDKARRVARRVPYRLLETVQSVGATQSETLLIQGDNLEALRSLQPLYAGRVECLGVDPRSSLTRHAVAPASRATMKGETSVRHS